MPTYIHNGLTYKLMEGLIMKKLVLFAVLPLLIAAGCTTQYQAKAPYDDVYYSSRDVPATTTTKVVVKQSQVPANSVNTNANPQEGSQPADDQSANAGQYSGYDTQPADVTTEVYTEPDGDTYISTNYYDDYYDYAYASRLRRFHSNRYFNNYYNDYYTNMYWYDYNPWSWGTSIYFNSGWFGPSFGMSFGWGWPSYSYGWGGYPSYGGYWQGYTDGYYNGYYAGSYNNGWYNNEGGWYNNNSKNYYGHRGQSGFASGSSNGRNTTGANNQAQGRMVKQTSDIINNANGRNTGNNNENPSVTNGRVNNSNASRDITPPNGRNAEAAPVKSIQQNTQGRTTQNNPTSTSPRVNPTVKQSGQPGRGRYVAPSQYRQKVAEPARNPQGRQVAPQTRYTNPQQQNNSGSNTNAKPRGNVYKDNTSRQAAQPARTYPQPGTRIQSYSSPSYSKPRSSQEYTTPKYRDMRNSGINSQPQQRSGSNSRDNGAIRESTPRESSNQPSSESQPNRSTYSTPSRSNDNNYSAPSRSNSSSGDNSSRSNSNSNSNSSSGSSRSSGSGNGRR